MLHYQLVGAGPTLTLIHGFPMDASAWDTIVDDLKEDYTLLLINLYGCGSSPEFEGALTMEVMAKAVHDVWEREDIESTIIVGHSMGGYLALELLKHYPSKVAGVSLVHSLANADTSEKQIMRQKAVQLISNYDSGLEQFLKGMVGNLFADSFSDEAAFSYVFNSGMDKTPKAVANLYDSIRTRSCSLDLLQQSSTPIQWIIGAEDKATPMAVALRQVGLANINDVIIFPNIGHMSMFECPELLIKALSSFCHFITNR